MQQTSLENISSSNETLDETSSSASTPVEIPRQSPPTPLPSPPSDDKPSLIFRISKMLISEILQHLNADELRGMIMNLWEFQFNENGDLSLSIENLISFVEKVKKYPSGNGGGNMNGNEMGERQQGSNAYSNENLPHHNSTQGNSFQGNGNMENINYAQTNSNNMLINDQSTQIISDFQNQSQKPIPVRISRSKITKSRTITTPPTQFFNYSMEHFTNPKVKPEPKQIIYSIGPCSWPKKKKRGIKKSNKLNK